MEIIKGERLVKKTLPEAQRTQGIESITQITPPIANNTFDYEKYKGIQKQEILLLEFCKNTQKQKRGQREQTM